MTKRHRISFDPEDPDIKKVLDEISEEIGIPPGDLLNLGTLDLIDAITNGEIDLESLKEPSRLPRYPWRLNLKARLERFRKRRH